MVVFARSGLFKENISMNSVNFNGLTLDITATLLYQFSSIENAPLYLYTRNLPQERIQ